jgi:dihydroxyacetone kinase
MVERFAGRLAEEGKSLEEIYEKTTEYERKVISVGASLGTCSQPGIVKDLRLDGNNYELGLGIHGEPGAQTLHMENGSAILDKMNIVLLNGLTQRKIDLDSHNFTLFVNNFGGVSALEMTFLSGKALDKLKALGVNVSHVAVGSFMTSLDMNGISLSLSATKTNEANHLLGKTGAPAWPELNAVSESDFLIPLDMPEDKKFEGPKISAEVKAKIAAAMKALIDLEPKLTEWDQKSGDGDCGQTFEKGALAILADLDSYPEDPASLCQAVSRTISRSMGGSSGVLLAMFFESAAAAIKDSD